MDVSAALWPLEVAEFLEPYDHMRFIEIGIRLYLNSFKQFTASNSVEAM
jgi:NADPH-dependent 7-cyano-7-deazaguanine reductase QueF-like protein